MLTTETWRHGEKRTQQQNGIEIDPPRINEMMNQAREKGIARAMPMLRELVPAGLRGDQGFVVDAKQQRSSSQPRGGCATRLFKA